MVDQGKYATSPGSIQKTPGGQTIVSNPVYGDVLNTEKYNEYVAQEQAKFNASVQQKKASEEASTVRAIGESQKLYEGKERFVSVLEDEKRSFSKQRYEFEKSQQNAVVEGANQRVADYSTEEFNKLNKQVEGAKSQFTSRQVVGYNTATYSTVTKTEPAKVTPITNANLGVRAPYANTKEGFDAMQKADQLALQNSSKGTTAPTIETNSFAYNPKISQQDNKFVSSLSPKINQPEKGYSPARLSADLPTGERPQEENIFLKTASDIGESLQKNLFIYPTQIGQQSKAEAVALLGKKSVEPFSLENAVAVPLSIPFAVKNVAVGVAGTALYAVTQPTQATERLVKYGQEKLAGLVTDLTIQALAGKGASEVFLGSKLTKFGEVKSIATEGPNGTVTLTSTSRMKTNGLIGKEFEVTGNMKLTPLDAEKLFNGNPFLKIKGPVQKVLIPEQAGQNFVKIEAGKQVLLLPEKLADLVVKKQGNELVLSNAELVKFRGPKEGFSAGKINKLEESVGQPFAVSSEGVVRVRKVGLLERTQESLGFVKKNDFVNEVLEAQKKGIAKGKTESFSGETFGVVQQREILVPKKGASEASQRGGFAQNILDIRRLGNEVKLLSERARQTFNPKNEVAEFGFLRGKGFGSRVNEAKPNVAITGTKGKMTSVEFKPNGDRVSSGPREFKTQDLRVEFNNGKTFEAQRAKIEGYPMEFKTLKVARAREGKLDAWAENIKSKPKRLDEGGGNALNEPQKRLAEPQKQLTGNSPLTPSDLEITKRQSGLFTPRGETSVQAGLNFVASKGTGAVQKMLFETKTRFGSSLTAGTTNAGMTAGRTQTLTRTQEQTKSQGQTKTNTQPKDATKTNDLIGSRFGQQIKTRFGIFADTKTIQSNAINTNTATKQGLTPKAGENTLTIPQSRTNVFPGTDTGTRISTLTGTSTNTLTRQMQNTDQLQKQYTPTRERTMTRAGFFTSPGTRFDIPFIPENKKRRQLYPEIKKNSRKKSFDVYSQRRGKEKLIGSNLDFSQGVRRGESFASNTLARSFGLRFKGYVEGNEDRRAQGLDRFRAPAPRSNLNKLGNVVFVQKSRFALSSAGERTEIRNSKKRRLF